jgi:hypothetical protein
MRYGMRVPRWALEEVEAAKAETMIGDARVVRSGPYRANPNLAREHPWEPLATLPICVALCSGPPNRSYCITLPPSNAVNRRLGQDF